MEKYISFSVRNLRFLDSYQFMPESLEKMVDNLSVGGLIHFHHFGKSFQNTDVARLLLRQNVYCYDYVDSHDNYERPLYHPQKRSIIVSRTNTYQTVIMNIHKSFGIPLTCNFLGKHQDVYLLTDVLLLTDVFERFRTMTL